MKKFVRLTVLTILVLAQLLTGVNVGVLANTNNEMSLFQQGSDVDTKNEQENPYSIIKDSESPHTRLAYSQNISEEKNTTTDSTITIKVVDKEENLITDELVDITTGETATDVLTKVVGEANIEVSSSGMITSIHGIGTEGTTYFWSFEVDGEPAQVGAGSYEVSPGETIAFKYTNWSTATVKVVDKEGKVITNELVDITTGETATDVLTRVVGEANIEVSSSGMITSIHGIGTEGTTYFWSFEVDGEPAQVGAGSYEVSPGETIAFKYTNWSTATVKVVDKEGKVITNELVDITTGETATDVLTRVVGEANIEVSSSGMITSIHGIGTEGTTYFWSFEVDGEPAQVGAGSYEVSPGETIAFKYTNWSTATVKVVDKEGKVITNELVDITTGETATDVLTRVVGEANIEVSSSGMITSIHGIGTEGTTYFWSFEIDGESAQVGAGSYEVSPGETIAFKYTNWSTATVKVVDKDGNVITNELVDITTGETATDVLTRVVGEANIEVSSSGMITSIHGIGTEGTTYFWSFEVDGEPAQVGAGSYGVTPGKKLEFRYISWDQDSDITEPTNPVDVERDLIEQPTHYDQETLESINQIINSVGSTVLSKGISSDWNAIAVSIAGRQVSQSYLDELVEDVQNRNGTYSSATDYARIILTAKSLGANPESLGGYNLVEKLYNFEELTEYTNNVIYALIAFDSGDYTIPNSAKWSKTQILNSVLEKQNSDGGWSWLGSVSDIDLTGMALTALAPYTNQTNVNSAINDAITWLTKKQQENGGFEVPKGYDPVPSISQAIIGLTSIGVSPSNEEFTKNNNNLITELLNYYKENEMIFYHEKAGSDKATQQALQALVSYKHYIENKGLIYQFKGEFGTSPIGNNPGGDNGPVNNTEQKTVQVIVKGLNGTNILDRTISVTGNPTPYSVLIEAIGTGNVNINGSGSTTYVTGINGLMEFDHGPESGWNYSVNGQFPTASAGAYLLENGDQVRWLYTIDLGNDVGAGSTGPVTTPIDTIVTTEILDEQRKNTEKEIANINEITFENNIPLHQLVNKTVVVIDNDRMTTLVAKKLKEAISNNIIKENRLASPNNETVIADKMNEVTLIIPKNALQTEKTIQVEKLQDQDINKAELVSPIYQFGPKGTTFDKPIFVSIQIPIEISELEDLALVWLNEDTNEWIPIPATVDPKTGIVMGLVNHFTKFAVVDRSKLEPKFKVTNELNMLVNYLQTDQTQSEWEDFGLARLNQTNSQQVLTDIAKKLVEENGTFRKITDYERYALTVAALGGDPTNIANYNLIEKIYNNERMTMQGTNGLIFALIALDSKNYQVPVTAKWTREQILAEILKNQNPDGGFTLVYGEKSDVDITAMALSALAHYKEQENVQTAIDKGIAWLSSVQQTSGGFIADGKENSESASQVIIALAALGTDPQGASFTKANGDVISNLLSYQKNDGGFSNIGGQSSNQIASEQALLALVAFDRFVKNQASLYQLQDESIDENEEVDEAIVNIPSYVDESEISAYALTSVYQAYSTGLMRGVDTKIARFAPKQPLTRAQFTAILMKLLNEQAYEGNETVFEDVKPGQWYYGTVMRAKQLGIVGGVSETLFDANEPVTREQVALLITRAYQLKPQGARNRFTDIDRLNNGSQAAILAIDQFGIMKGTGVQLFSPYSHVTREMGAVIAVRMAEGL
ncbi:DUF4430 domain-containing protein [Bacillus sp. Marseille-P3661]|uniref:DUF4430 domain-containing protein n=1 Tax=Bacillus sp. Marseille-P3661 TaxID=1936234 RepID=UPI000C868552|nr:DUF4430 domain-containing protein [Bacillus sp. Marseille-P3661]